MANQVNQDHDVDVIYPKSDQHDSGIDLRELKKQFIHHDRKNLYKTVFYLFSLIVFYLLIRVYFVTDFSKLAILLDQSASDSYFVYNQWFRILFWFGTILLLLVELAAFWQRKLHLRNDYGMLIIISAYIFAGIYWLTSRPLFQFLSSYYTNSDPFKSFSTSLEVLQKTNISLMVLSLIFSLLLFAFGYFFILLRKLGIKLIKVKKEKSPL